MLQKFTPQDEALVNALYADTFCIVSRADRNTPVRVRSMYAGNVCFADVRDLDEHCQPIAFDASHPRNTAFVSECEREVMRATKLWLAHRNNKGA